MGLVLLLSSSLAVSVCVSVLGPIKKVHLVRLAHHIYSYVEALSALHAELVPLISFMHAQTIATGCCCCCWRALSYLVSVSTWGTSVP